MNDYDKAHWLADKIVVWDDYTKEAAFVLKRQAEELATLRHQLAECQTELEAVRKDAEQIKRLVLQIGIVGQINGHDVIRRESALELIDRVIAIRGEGE